MSRREKMLLLATGAVIALLLLDQYALGPFLAYRDQLDKQSAQYQADIGRDGKVLKEYKRLKPEWERLAAGGLKEDPAEAESQLLHALLNWSKETGLAISSEKPERPETKERLKEIQVQVVGSGPWDSVPRFLFKVQSAALPVKIMELHLGARNDTSHEVSVQIKISTL